MLTLATIFAAILTHGCATVDQSRPAGTLKKARRIVFLGDSITYAGKYVAYFDAWLCASHPKQDHIILNLGLPSETVSGLNEPGHAGGRFPRPDLAKRLDNVMKVTRPDLVIACYGMNCGVYMPFDEERFAKYQNGMLRLKQAAEQSGARIVFVTPPIYDHQRGETETHDYSTAVLRRYGEWLLSKRAEGWDVIDLHNPMQAALDAKRVEDPAFTFQPDGVHPDDTGHWLMARQLIGYFGDANAAAAGDPEEMLAAYPGGVEILPLVEQRMAILRDAWLTHAGHSRPEISEGLPFDQATRKAEELSNEIESRLTTASEVK